MTSEQDELIEAQKQVIGVLFEVIKRLQANSDLDEEYFEIVSDPKRDKSRLDKIIDERAKNSEIVGRLLRQLET